MNKTRKKKALQKLEYNEIKIKNKNKKRINNERQVKYLSKDF